MPPSRKVPFWNAELSQLSAAFERNLEHTRPRQRPAAVDADVWDRYEAGRPWVLLNVGVIGLILDSDETYTVLAEASKLFHEIGSNYWLVAELLRSEGNLTGSTSFDTPLVSEVWTSIWKHFHGTSATGRPGIASTPMSRDAPFLLFMAIATTTANSSHLSHFDDLSSTYFNALISNVRSEDAQVDRRLENLRAIARRKIGDPRNVKSLNALIWSAIKATAIQRDERELGYALMGVEPMLDPTTLAAGMLIFANSNYGRARPSGELDSLAGRRPRGWDSDIDLKEAGYVHNQYRSILRRAEPKI